MTDGRRRQAGVPPKPLLPLSSTNANGTSRSSPIRARAAPFEPGTYRLSAHHGATSGARQRRARLRDESLSCWKKYMVDGQAGPSRTTSNDDLSPSCAKIVDGPERLASETSRRSCPNFHALTTTPCATPPPTRRIGPTRLCAVSPPTRARATAGPALLSAMRTGLWEDPRQAACVKAMTWRDAESCACAGLPYPDGTQFQGPSRVPAWPAEHYGPCSGPR